MLFWAQLGVGVAKSNNLPVHGSLLADTYPIGVRGRIGATLAMGSRLAACSARSSSAASPRSPAAPTVGGGPFLLLAIPVAVFAVFAFRLPEPPRGQFEKQDVLGEVIEDAKPAPISIEAAFARLLADPHAEDAWSSPSRRWDSGCSPSPVLANLFMEDEYGIDDVRAWGGRHSIGGLGALARAALRRSVLRPALPREPGPRVATHRDPGVLPAAVLTPVQYFMPNPVLFTLCGIPQAVMLSAAFTMVGAGAAVGRARTDCAAWVRRSGRSTSSSSARPAARSSPRCSPTRSARAPRCSRSSSRRRSSAA